MQAFDNDTGLGAHLLLRLQRVSAGLRCLIYTCQNVFIRDLLLLILLVLVL